MDLNGPELVVSYLLVLQLGLTVVRTRTDVLVVE
jgi:hypothetical protein